jgi:ribonuclease HI
MGQTWAGDGSAHKGSMGAGSLCHQHPGQHTVVRVSREEEGISSLRPELAAVASTLQVVALKDDLLYLCDSEATLDIINRWIGAGPRATLAGDVNADIMWAILNCLQQRVNCGARTILVKIKAHRGEPLNERADSEAEAARTLPAECHQWTRRTSRMTYEWQDKGTTWTSVWSKGVRKAMQKGGANF